ncbi:MAG: DNA repair exonuclease [Candidatus Lokiarchaeota archaeon]|nr:DNA repair exonuclease [Candidatus Lokiarchaeota archaeon]
MTSAKVFEPNLENLTKNQYGNNHLTKFIHASDIHLGSHQYRNDYRANDFIFAFEEILSIAVIHRVDFLLLGGDVFTSLEMLPGKLTKIVNLLTNFKKVTKNQILIIAIEGNHDIRKFSRGQKFKQRGQSWLKLLASLGLIILLDADVDLPSDEIFKEYDFKTRKGGKIRIKDVIIYGTRYLGQNPVEYLLKLKDGIEKDDDLFHILLQHFGIKGQMEQVPGVDYRRIQILKNRVNYLALGHFHLQFILDDWIFNPGSSEASCSSDFSFKRGVFLVTITKNDSYTKCVNKIRLTNRTSRWEHIYFKTEFSKKEKMYEYIIQKLKKSFDLDKNLNKKSFNIQTPVLFLVLKGKKPFYRCKIDKKELTQIICENLPVVDVRIYQKFSDFLKTLDTFF